MYYRLGYQTIISQDLLYVKKFKVILFIRLFFQHDLQIYHTLEI